MSRNKTTWDCYDGRRLVCTGTLDEVAEAVGWKPATARSVAYGVGGHRYQLYRRPRREQDLEDMARMGIPPDEA